jgi:tripartite-type tricarboxylate transporter receptor subunit TctC
MKKFIITLITCVLSFGVYAQNNQPIKIVVPLGAGGGIDISARTIAKNLSEIMKTPVIVENKPGANGVLGAKAVLSEESNGRTLLFYIPHAYDINNIFTETKENIFEWEKELTPLSMFYFKPFFMLVNKKLNVNNLTEFKEKYKNKEVTFGSTGSGTAPHIYGEIFLESMEVKPVHIPYRASPQMIVDTINGSVDLVFLASALNHVKAGNLVPLLYLDDKKHNEFTYVEKMNGNLLNYSDLRIIPSFLVHKNTSQQVKSDLIRNLELATKMSIDELEQKNILDSSQSVVFNENKFKSIGQKWIYYSKKIKNKR